MQMDDIKHGKRYWFFTGSCIRSGLYTGRIKRGCYIVQCKNGDTWMIPPCDMRESKEDAIEFFGDLKVYEF